MKTVSILLIQQTYVVQKLFPVQNKYSLTASQIKSIHLEIFYCTAVDKNIAYTASWIICSEHLYLRYYTLSY